MAEPKTQCTVQCTMHMCTCECRTISGLASGLVNNPRPNKERSQHEKRKTEHGTYSFPDKKSRYEGYIPQFFLLQSTVYMSSDRFASSAIE